MISKRDFFTYAKIILILTICFAFIGNYIYDENFESQLSNYSYLDEPLNSMYQKQYNDFVLEGGHDYIFYFFVEGRQDSYLNINMIFETMDNITLSYGTGANETMMGVWGENKIYTEPLFIPQNETISITISTMTSDLEWQMVIYQDLPIWLTKPIPIVAFFTILLLAIWAIAYEQYEKIFTDITKQKRTLVKETEEEPNVE
ncbi:MAG: hypothetical protein ACTSQ5_09450 [Promethearchaeota archaeon]